MDGKEIQEAKFTDGGAWIGQVRERLLFRITSGFLAYSAMSKGMQD